MKINGADTAFVLLSAALVLLMTPGLAFFYGGLVRRKNVLAIMMQSFISMGVVTVIWVLVGFSLAYSGDDGGIIGNFKWLGLARRRPRPPARPTPRPSRSSPSSSSSSCSPSSLPRSITGAFADRVSFRAYLLFLVLWSLLVYIPFVHWIWGGGFLAQWGVKDFAGGIVVHLSAGMAALASVFVVGRRKLAKDEKPPPTISPSSRSAPDCFWFGFNGGSALAANGVAAVAFVNTNA